MDNFQRQFIKKCNEGAKSRPDFRRMARRRLKQQLKREVIEAMKGN